MIKLLLCLLGIALLHNVQAQFKTGIKTRQWATQNASNLITLNDTTSFNYNEFNSTVGGASGAVGVGHWIYNTSFVPADVYQGGDYATTRHTTRPPVFLDATAEFINKTRASMANGVCTKEVPIPVLMNRPDLTPQGNGSTPNTSRIFVCCAGYERNPHIYKRCDPICKDNCPNGICTAPDTCVCIPGHVRNEEDRCISTCPLGCGNGRCNDDNECECLQGYKLEPLERKYCLPHCQNGCEFGKCVAPNKCACVAGYQLTASGHCEAKCDNCVNGRCTAPGVCTCDTGYKQINGICEPICALGCNKGRCVAPDTCECSDGFQLDRAGSACVPHCDQPCLNGFCDGANLCACNSGYILDENQRNICRPHCAQGCPNGYCTSPGLCVCRPGFVKSGIKGHKTCVPAQ